LAVGSRSGGWDLMQARGRVDRYPAGLTGGVAWARPLDADPTIQKLCMRAAAASSRRRGEARRRAAASGGANSIRHWGVPIAAGFALRRRARACEPTGGLHGRRRNRTTAPGEARRRHTTGDGEDDGAAHEHPNQMHRGVPHQAAKLRDGSNRPGRRRDGGERAETERRRFRARVMGGGGARLLGFRVRVRCSTGEAAP
jgi:hypothetical protein